MTAPIDSNLTDAERAAVLLMVLGDEEAAGILGQLDPDELHLVGTAMCALDSEVGTDRISAAIMGFIGHADTDALSLRDAHGRTRDVMTRAVGEVKADCLMQRIAPDRKAPSIELARWLAPHVLVPLIEDEHPQAIAVMLLMLEPQQAASLLTMLPAAVQPAVVERIARLGAVSAHSVDMLNDLIGTRLERRFGKAALTMGGARDAAMLINQAAGVEAVVMPVIGANDADLAALIEAEMFKFEVILSLDAKDMGRLLREIENDTLIDALKGLVEDEREPVFAAMSARAADGVRDELETRGRTKKSAVEEAQQKLIEVARSLAEQGEIALGIGGGDSDYV